MKNRWECRVPLSPINVKELIEADSQVTIQPCTKRVFSDEEYSSVGARLSNNLNDCDIILGVKEIPKEDLIPNKQYIFFSHTHKGQQHNMPMLSDIVQKVSVYNGRK